MHRLFSITILSLTALTVGTSAPSVLAWQSPPEKSPTAPPPTENPPTEKFVVLKNHQTIHGIVEQQPEKISVRLPSGSLIVLPKSRVLLVGESPGTIYWELAARTRSTDVKGQIEVYRWCVRNNLFDEAANHLLILQEMDIPAKTLMQLDVSLKITKKRYSESQQKLAAAQKKPKTLPPSRQASSSRWQDDQAIEIPDLHQPTQISDNSKRLPTIDEFGNQIDSRIDRNLQQVSWDQPITENTKQRQTLIPDETLRRRLGATESVSYAALDGLTRSMPNGAVGLFRKQVEPVLRQACSDCHRWGSSETAFEIFQSHNGTIDRRMSQKNLFQVLNLADNKHPWKSPLIRYATSAHGNQTSPSFQWQDAQLDAVKRWLIMVSDNPSLPLEKFGAGRGQEQSPLIAPPKVIDRDPRFGKRLPSHLPASDSESPEAADHSVEKVDPFDAETFNRRFGAR